MATPHTGHEPNPALIFDTLNRYQHTMALKGAIDLELFTHIADGAVTPAAIAPRCNASERGVRILCDFLTIMGFLTKTDGVYGLTQDSTMFPEQAVAGLHGQHGELSGERHAFHRLS
jgi:hypothetical protein